MINTKITKIKIISTLFVAFLVVSPVNAAVNVNSAVQLGTKINTEREMKQMASTTKPILNRFASSTEKMIHDERPASTTINAMRDERKANVEENRMEKATDRGNAEIDKRIKSLTALVSRIQGMKFVSDSEKSSIIATLNVQIAQLTTLKTQIDADTSTTSLKNDVTSITKAYRIYALVNPQAQITAAGDRVLSIVNTLNTVVTKLNARIASSSNLSVTVQTSLADLTSKLADATSQAKAAIDEVAPLVPDNGDTTVATSNMTKLKDARSKIQLAEKDLIAARQDIQSILKALISK